MIYSTNYFGWEPPRPQAVPIRVITDGTHPIPVGDERIAGISWWAPAADTFHGRVCSAWWGMHPDLVADDEVTVAIGGNFTIRDAGFEQRCLDELGDDEMLLMRHPWRDDILDEAQASLLSWRWSDQPVVAQAEAYIAAGHPRGWGLFHAGLIVRRNTPAVRAFNEAWWQDFRVWSSQSQVSLPPLLRTSGIRWHTWPDSGAARAQPFDEGWVSWGDLGAAA